MPENFDNRIYEEQKNQEKGQEQLKQHDGKTEQEKKTGKNLSKKISNIDKNLSKFGENGKDFFIRNMNDYVQSKFGVKFEKTSVGGKEELVLVIPKEKQANPDPIKGLKDLAKNLVINNKNEVFIDENGNKKLDTDEIGIKIDKDKIEANAIYVDKEELKNTDVDFGNIKENISAKDVQTINNLIGQINENLGDPSDQDYNKFKNFKFENTPEGIKKLYKYVDFLSKKTELKIKNKETETTDPFGRPLSNYDRVDKLLKHLSTIFKHYKQQEPTSKPRQILDKEYTHGGKIIFENGKSYYKVGGTTDKNGHYDYLSAVSRLFTAISTEYLGGMDLKTIDEKIKNLGYNKKTGEFKILKKGEEKGFVKVGNINSPEWKHIVQPGAKIDLSSLSKALTSGKVEKQTKVEKKELKNNIDWGRFYESTDGETWDIPDNWNINYKGYSESFSGLNGSQISICAKNDYDFGNKDKGLNGVNNTFSGKIEVDLGKDKKGYLVIGETSNPSDILNKVSGKRNITELRDALKNSKTEAWFTTVDKKGNATITEVGDKKVQTITETSNTVERGKDKNHPIVLSGNKYKFSGEIDGNITFDKKFAIDDKNSNLKNIQSQKNFEKVFGGEKAYLLVKNHLVELSWGKETIISKDLGEQKNIDTKFDNGGVTIENSLFSDMKFDKKTGKVEFPEVSGWGQINGKLKKTIKNNKEKGIKKGDILFTLGEEYKIGGKEVIINLGANTKLKPNKIFENTIKGLLLLATKKDLKNNPGLGEDTSINITGDSIIIPSDNKITLNKLPEDDILTFQKGEKSDTYIIDAIKNKFEKKSEKHKKKEQTLSKKTNSKEGKSEKITKKKINEN